MLCSRQKRLSPSRSRLRQRCCSLSGVSVVNLLPSYGRRGCSGTLITGDTWRPMPVSRLRLGKVVQSIANRACQRLAIRDCGRLWRSSPCYGCVINLNLRWRFVRGARQARRRARAQIRHCCAGSKVAGRALEICNRRGRHRRCHSQSCLRMTSNPIPKSARA